MVCIERCEYSTSTSTSSLCHVNLILDRSTLIYHESYQNVSVMSDYLTEKYNNIQTAQWIFLIFTCGLSLTMAFGFSLAELFRREEYNGVGTNASVSRRVNFKSTFELSLEGISLLILVLLWVPLVVIATTDGCCSEVGNSYYLTWASAYAVLQTFITWLQDWRKGVHELLLRQDREYREAQANVELMDDDEIDDDEILELSKDDDEVSTCDVAKVAAANDIVVDR